MKKLLTLSFRAWIVLILCLVGGCGLGDAPLKHTLRIAIDAEPRGLDPHIVTGLVEYNVLQSMFEGLVNLDPKTLEPTPGVAERWEISADGKTYTFHLRPDAQWSDGSALTTEDFLFSWERILNPKLAAEYAFLFYPIKNAEAYNQGTLNDFSQVGIRALNTHTLEVELDNPTPYFLSLQINFAYYPVPRHAIEAHGSVYNQASRWTRTGNLISNGPFRLKEWKLSQYVAVERNPHYWDNARTRLDALRFYPIKNMNTEERAFRAGQIHVTANVPLSSIAQRILDKDTQLRIDPDLGVYYYMLNVDSPVLKDPRVRRALSISINRAQIAQAIRQRDETPAYSLISTEVSNYANQAGALIEENIEEAQRLLAEAGYPQGKGFPKLELLYNTSDQHRQIAVAVQSMWERNLGIQTELFNQTWKVYLESRAQGNYQIARAGWFADYNDPMTFLEIWTSTNGMNHSRWKNSQFDSLLAQAAQTPAVDARARLLRKAEMTLIEEAPIIPVFFYKRAYLISPEVRNWQSNVMNCRAYQHVWLATETTDADASAH